MSQPRKKTLGPIKDPFRREILRALDEVQIDGQLFERAMCSLLEHAPVSGGQDQGFDGAVTDKKGEPYPLVCTTAEDVEGNLRHSLDSYLKNGWRTKKAALVTSRCLTPRRRKALRDIARERKITLKQILDREAVADLLVKNEQWCRELIGVRFRFPSLSEVPRSRRPLREIPLEGRAEDLDWLRSTTGDRILVGEPGSGKTFALYHLIRREGWPALFLTDLEATNDAIVVSLRELQPAIVILDDAHVHLGLLERLLDLRARDLVPPFDLVASTWRGGVDRVALKFGNLPATKIRRLDLLTRDEIVRVIRSVGLELGEDAMGFLVTQASNRPGLAVTLATLVMQGAGRELLNGSAMAKELLSFIEQGSSPKATQVLAGLSLGGDGGMRWEDVDDDPRIGGGTTATILADLEAGGVLREVDPKRGILAVWPPMFRSALLRTTFFSGKASRVPYRDLFEKAPRTEKAVEAILGAIETGGEIEREEIRNLVARAGSSAAWKRLAALDEAYGEWVLENYPGDVRDVAAGALRTSPALTVRKVLKRAELDLQEGVPERDVRFPLNSWIEEFGAPDPIQRREILAQVGREFLASGGITGVGLRAILLALSPKMRGSRLDPGAGRTVSLWEDLLPALDLERLTSIWALARSEVREIDSVGWSYLASSCWTWAHPDTAVMVSKLLDERRRSALLALGQLVLTDLVPLAKGRPGLSAGLAELAADMGIQLGVEQDPIMDLLLSEPVAEGAKLEELADLWQAAGPREAVQRLAFYRAEALRIGKIWNLNFGRVCRILAGRVQLALPWLEALMERELEAAVVRPFLEIVVEHREGGWERELSTCLDLPFLSGTALEVALGVPDLPEVLVGKVVSLVSAHSYLIGRVSREIPLPTLRALLRHDSTEVALAAAVEEWDADPRKSIRREIAEEWREAMLRSAPSDATGIGYLQEAILLEDDDLAVDWLRARLESSEETWLGERSRAATIARSLPLNPRMELIRTLGPMPGSRDLAPALVDRDTDAYRLLLAHPNRDLHLVPLGREPDEEWAIFATMALNAGFTPAEVARASGPNSTFFAGTRAAPYRERLEKLARFGGLLHQGLREVVRIVSESVRKDLRHAEERDREAELYGLGHTAS